VNDGFFRCTVWRSVAENAAHSLKKGMRVFVAGKLVQRSWQDKRRQQASERRDPGDPCGPGPPIRYRRGSRVHRRGFPGPYGGRRVIPSSPRRSSEPGFGRASTRQTERTDR
jgi:single-strand DNA-binding protein